MPWIKPDQVEWRKIQAQRGECEEREAVGSSMRKEQEVERSGVVEMQADAAAPSEGEPELVHELRAALVQERRAREALEEDLLEACRAEAGLNAAGLPATESLREVTANAEQRALEWRWVAKVSQERIASALAEAHELEFEL